MVYNLVILIHKTKKKIVRRMVIVEILVDCSSSAYGFF